MLSVGTHGPKLDVALQRKGVNVASYQPLGKSSSYGCRDCRWINIELNGLPWGVYPPPKASSYVDVKAELHGS
jgi:hypothetical protein